MRITASKYDEIRPGRCSEEPLERVSLLIPAPVKERLEDIADEQGCSLNSVVRACLNKTLGLTQK